jgi:hypothetical protein
MESEIRTDNKEDAEKLRAEAAALLAQAQNQLAEVQRALAGAGGDSAAHARLSAAAAHLSAIVSQLSNAVNARFFPLRGADLIGIQGVVGSGEAHAAVAEAATASTQAGAQSAAYAAAGANVAAASLETRHETETLAHDVFDQRIFDPYLRFKSQNDEEEYRRREADNKRYIEQQLAKHTPEGDLNAGGGMIGQMLDAHDHGAGASPQFMPKFNALVEKTETQRNAMKAAGQSTQEFDHRLDAAVRRSLEYQKGLSGAEIDKRMGTFANPLDAAKSLLKDDNKSGDEKGKPSGDKHSSIDLDDIRSKLKAAGVTGSDNSDADASPKHGVNVQKTAAKDGAARSA